MKDFKPLLHYAFLGLRWVTNARDFALVTLYVLFLQIR